jgi:predicted N-acetyltransferase YhbS
MVREGLKIAADKGHRGVIVQCNGDYYPRFGFLPAEIFGIRYPVKIPPGAFLAIELGEGSLAGYNGTVNYPEVYGI